MYLSKFCTSLNTGNSLTITDREKLSIAQIEPWECGLGLRLVKGKKCKFDFLDQEMTLLNKAHNNEPSLPIHEFVKSIPHKYKEAILKQQSQQYSLLHMFRHIPASFDLYQSNRLLLSLIIFRQISLFETAKLVKMPQHLIVKTLYPINKSTLGYKPIVRMLKKQLVDYGRIKDVERIDVFLTKLLAGELCCNNEKNISHIKYIPTFIIKGEFLAFIFLLHPSLIFDPINKLFDDQRIGNSKCSFGNQKEQLTRILSFAQDTLYTAITLKIDEGVIKKRLYRAKNFDLLMEYHDDVVDEREVLWSNKCTKNIDIPEISEIDPPVPGTGNIIPIRNYSGFITESNEMKHCLDSAEYIFNVKDGHCYIYAVKTENDRCTLELGINEDDSLFIKQLEGYRNSSPLYETRNLVEMWLADSKRYS